MGVSAVVGPDVSDADVVAITPQRVSVEVHLEASACVVRDQQFGTGELKLTRSAMGSEEVVLRWSSGCRGFRFKGDQDLHERVSEHRFQCG